MSDHSLHQVLRSLGYATEQVADLHGRSKAILRDGAEAFRGDSLEVWDWLRSTRQVPPLVKCDACAHDRPRGGCAHPKAGVYGGDFWRSESDPDEQGRPWCHSYRGGIIP